MNENIHPISPKVTAKMRSELLNHQPATVWLTGLSGSGKSTIASIVESELYKSGVLTYLVDGDNMRVGLCKNLGFTSDDRTENIRRVAELCKSMNDAGVFVIAALISPIQADRDMAKSIIGDKFKEVYVKASIETCETRDPKGLYKKARAGEIKNFTGVSAVYEEPINPDLILDTEECDIENNVNIALHFIKQLINYKI